MKDSPSTTDTEVGDLMEFEHKESAEVIDISPVTCHRCGAPTYEEDAYCGSCGLDLLASLPVLCSKCGKALSSEIAFCTSCGAPATADAATATTTTTPIVGQTVTLSEPFQNGFQSGVGGKSRSKRAVLISSLLVLTLAAVAAGGWWWSQPDLSLYDAHLASATSLLTEVQDEVDDLSEPVDLPAFASYVGGQVEVADALARRGGAIEGEDFEAAAADVLKAEVAYLEELERLASLGSADVDRSEFQRIEELGRELELAVVAGLDLRGDDLDISAIELSVAPLTSSLMDLAAYREEVIKVRARIAALNKERAAELAQVETFLGQFDGVVERYSTARAELADWIEGVDSDGASFNEAYEVLYQQAERRRQLRDELAAIDPPAEFAPDQAALLAVMDQAVDATEAASRGISEYQFDWSYRSYDETPGWRTFEAETSEISDAFTAALSAYEVRREEVVQRLSKKKPLPALPE